MAVEWAFACGAGSVGVDAAGATVLARGGEAGTVMVVLAERGGPGRAFEQMPVVDGDRVWALARAQGDDSGAFGDWLARRRAQDPDLWIVELDIAQGERFIGLSGDC
jgi:hypothetical protein